MKVLFIDTVHPLLKEELEKHRFVCTDGYHLNREELLNEIKKYQGIVIRSKFSLDQEFFNHAQQLKFVARAGSGLENIDINCAEVKGVKVFNSPEGNRMAVAEHITGMLLSLFNHLNRGDREVRNGIWRREENRGIELSSKTVGIIGFGNNGTAFAEVLGGFGCRILAHDKYKSGFGNERVEEVDLPTLQQACDVISFHLPLTDETKYIFNDAFLSHCQHSLFLINSSRGKIVDTKALVSGMKQGKILGACLDVFEYEKSSFENLSTTQLPEAFQYLIDSERVMLSPHVAGWTRESYIKLSEVLANKILKIFS